MVVKQVAKTLLSEERRQIRDPEAPEEIIMAGTITTMAEAVAVVQGAIHAVSLLAPELVIPHVPDLVTQVVVPVV